MIECHCVHLNDVYSSMMIGGFNTANHINGDSFLFARHFADTGREQWDGLAAQEAVVSTLVRGEKRYGETRTCRLECVCVCVCVCV